jgi:hypothetical protein
MNRNECRSCGARIRWGLTPKGKAVPVDWEPVAEGNLVLEVYETDLTVTVLPFRKGKHSEHGPRYVSHFATCPQAKAWRRP